MRSAYLRFPQNPMQCHQGIFHGLAFASSLHVVQVNGA